MEENFTHRVKVGEVGSDVFETEALFTSEKAAITYRDFLQNVENQVAIVESIESPEPDYEELIKKELDRIVLETTEHRDEMLHELLYRFLRGETVTLVQQKTFDGSLIKYQYQWQKITLPEIPLSDPTEEED